MFSSFSNSFKMAYYKALITIITNYIQFTYNITGTPNDAVLLNSPDPFPIDFINGGAGKAEGMLNELNATSFVNKNVSLYFKAINFLDGFNYAASLCYFGTNPPTTNKFTIIKNNDLGTSYKIVCRSNGLLAIDTTFTTSGNDTSIHVFIRINDTNQLRVNIYDALGVSYYSSGIKTIDSSVFGNDYTVWSLNHDGAATGTSVVRRTTTFEAGKWNKVITDEEMATHLAFWLDPMFDIYGALIFYTFETQEVKDRSGNGYEPIVYGGITTTNAWAGDYSLEGDGLTNNTSITYVDVPFTIPIPNGMSISMWVYQKATGPFTYKYMIDFGNQCHLAHNEASTNRLRWGSSSIFLFYDTPVDAWYHQVFTVSNGNVGKIYINNVLLGTTTFGGAAQTAISNFRIGNTLIDSNNGAHYGFIDNVRIYDSVIDTTKINDLYNEISN